MKHTKLIQYLTTIETITTLYQSDGSYDLAYETTINEIVNLIPQYIEITHILEKYDDNTLVKLHQILEWLSIFGELNDITE